MRMWKFYRGQILNEVPISRVPQEKSEMIAFFELHPEHFVNVCVRAFMTVMNDRLIQFRSRLFSEVLHCVPELWSILLS